MSSEPTQKSWWEEAPRDGFTAQADAKVLQFSASEEAQMVHPIVIAMNPKVSGKWR